MLERLFFLLTFFLFLEPVFSPFIDMLRNVNAAETLITSFKLSAHTAQLFLIRFSSHRL